MLGLLVATLIKTQWPDAEFDYSDHEAEPGVVHVVNNAIGSHLRVFSGKPSAATLAIHLQDQKVSLLSQGASREELMAGLRGLAGGPAYVSRDFVRILVEPKHSQEPLTPRERQVVELVVAGLTNNEIAAQLYVSPHTVRTHLQSVSSRLGVSSRGKLAARARELGLV